MFGRLYTHSVNVQLNKGSDKSMLPILSSKGLFWDSHSPLRQGSAPAMAAQSKPEVAVNTGRKTCLEICILNNLCLAHSKWARDVVL